MLDFSDLTRTGISKLISRCALLPGLILVNTLIGEKRERREQQKNPRREEKKKKTLTLKVMLLNEGEEGKLKELQAAMCQSDDNERTIKGAFKLSGHTYLDVYETRVLYCLK